MKYLNIIKFKFLTALQFRSEVLLWIFLDFAPFLFLFFIFSTLYQQQSVIRGLTFTQTLEYYFIAMAIQGLTTVHFESWRSEEIRLGKIDFFLIRPFSYLKEILLSDIATKLLFIVIFFPLYALFLLMIQYTFDISLFQDIGFSGIPVFLALLVGAYGIQLMIGTLITLLTFWFEGAEGLQHFKWVVVTVLSGATLPIEFLPVWLQSIVQMLPFKYLYAFPIAVFQQRAVITLTDISVILVSMVSLIILVRLILYQGITKYSSSGG